HFLGKEKFNLKMESSKFSNDEVTNMSVTSPELLKTKSIIDSTWKARPKRKISTSPIFDPDSINIHYIVNAQGKKLPYAMSSATTYLVPTADCWENLYSVCPDIQWIKPKRNSAGRIVKYLVEDPAKVAGALTLVERNKLKNDMSDIIAQLKNTERSDYAAVEVLAALFQQYVDDESGLQAPPKREDVFPDALQMYYVKFSNCSDKPTADDPSIGGMDDRCVCSFHEPNGGYTNYLVSLPLSNQAKDWMLASAGQYSVRLAYEAGRPQFVASYAYRNQLFEKIFDHNAANLHEINQATMSVTALWPRYKMNDWKKYYVFRQHAIGARIGDGITYYIEPEEKAENENIFETEDAGTLKYSAMNKWPSTWELWRNEPSGAKSAVGYFLTRAVVAPNKIPGKVYKAAIDFGTSSTMLYGGDSDSDAAIIDGRNLWSLPLFAPRSIDGATAIFRFFIPPTNSITNFSPLQSILAIENEDKAPVLTGNWTYFQQAAVELSRRELSPRFTTHSNLKWDPIAGKIYTTSFLLMIAYYILLEARANGCSTLDTMISYPSAMSGWADYVKKMNQQLECAQEVAKIELVDNHAAEERKIQWKSKTITESRAVAQRMCLNHQATQFCSIDIGGGTSDIFIFKNDGDEKKLTWDGYESSLLCGARSILLESFVQDQNCLHELIGLAAKDSIMAALKEAVPQMESWATSKLNREKIQSNIEFLLSVKFMDSTNQWHNAGEELRQRAVSQVGLTNRSVSILRKRVAYYTAAILFYAGMMTRDTGTKVDQLHLRFAGNGSRTLQWISNDDNNTKRFLSRLFNVGAGIEAEDEGQDFQNIQFASDPKHEVADGAMKRPIPMGKHIDEILSGEVVTLYDAAGVEFAKWSVSQNIAHELFHNAKSVIPGNETLKKFISAFREAMRSILLIPLRADEFNPEVADAPGVRLSINTKVADIVAGINPDKKSFFMIGVDALSDHYFKN
ncbi:MAG TPA: hypothetical protein VN631_02590, partial [Negativicutes bacterium]|nr:hypothetical protein [Negativicutes bacterium]